MRSDPSPAPCASTAASRAATCCSQELADLSGCELWRAAETETTALGAALLAALGSGLLASAAEIRSLLPEPARFAPALGAEARAARRARWQRALERV